MEAHLDFGRRCIPASCGKLYSTFGRYSIGDRGARRGNVLQVFWRRKEQDAPFKWSTPRAGVNDVKTFPARPFKDKDDASLLKFVFFGGSFGIF